MRKLYAILVGFTLALGGLFAGVQQAHADTFNSPSVNWGYGYANASPADKDYHITADDDLTDGYCVGIERRVDIGGGQTGWVTSGFTGTRVDCATDGNEVGAFLSSAYWNSTLGLRLRKGSTSSVTYYCTTRTACQNA
jgi:hypothetical protein